LKYCVIVGFEAATERAAAIGRTSVVRRLRARQRGERAFELDKRVAALQTEVADADDPLRRLDRMIEEGPPRSTASSRIASPGSRPTARGAGSGWSAS
jgi:hypothetical protein